MSCTGAAQVTEPLISADIRAVTRGRIVTSGGNQSFTLRQMRADEASDPAGPRGRPTGGDDAGAAPTPPTTPRPPDELIAEYDDERPARRLGPRLDRVVVALCFLTSVFVLWQVFAPLRRGNQYYLILFLAAVLPLVFVCYRPRARTADQQRARRPRRGRLGACRPGPARGPLPGPADRRGDEAAGSTRSSTARAR